MSAGYHGDVSEPKERRLDAGVYLSHSSKNRELIMRTIFATLVALSVLGGVAASAHAEKKSYFGSPDWWAQQDSNRN
jgi:hypothetical protein